MSNLGYSTDWSRVVKCGKYLAVYCPDHPRAWSTGYVYVHTVVMEHKLGRLLTKKEVVHHENRNGHDNDESNLEIKASCSAHGKEHAADRPQQFLSLVCTECGKQFPRRLGQEAEKKEYMDSFCSRSCNGRYQQKRNWHS